MYREGLGRRRGVSLALNERVFCANRTLPVPPDEVQEVSDDVVIPMHNEIRVHFDDYHVQDDWEPSWMRFDHADSAIERSIHKSSELYVNLLDEALAEVATLEKARAEKALKQQLISKGSEQSGEAYASHQATGAENTCEPSDATTPQQKPVKETQETNGPFAAQPLWNGIQATQNSPPPNVPSTVNTDNPDIFGTGMQCEAEELKAVNKDEAMSKSDGKKDYVPDNTYTQHVDSYEDEYMALRSEYEAFVQNGDPSVKHIRVDIAKKINTTVNTLANTQKQVDNSYTTLLNIKNQYENEPHVLLFLVFRVIEAVLDCCEPGCQMYLNPKSVWPSAHLIRGIMSFHSGCLAIYFTTMKKRCPYTIPRLYQGTDEVELQERHHYSKHNKNTYFKKHLALVRLHLALLVVTEDTKGAWGWFASFLNACTQNVFKLPLSGVLVTALTIAGHMCWRAYNEQFAKVGLVQSTAVVAYFLIIA
ncbi:uncharacterized protein BXIN_2184 [Babesia sp. Xinjiang]|uniref:uncharacterized protein n=1 Tax=Babesia sp. Xinjiang TaxID=462227 RepID=UPI000A258329|nr:uncharacterized protein BXIN_2184 [Babesia sp. Xinjiang]ORM40381.1 hypothetical protein BXIN_2184 [Babesia sp. Xinjiang]